MVKQYGYRLHPIKISRTASKTVLPLEAKPATMLRWSHKNPEVLEIAPEQRVAIQSTANVHIPTANAAPSNNGIGNGSHSPSNTPSTYNPAKINMGCFIN